MDADEAEAEAGEYRELYHDSDRARMREEQRVSVWMSLYSDLYRIATGNLTPEARAEAMRNHEQYKRAVFNSRPVSLTPPVPTEEPDEGGTLQK